MAHLFFATSPLHVLFSNAVSAALEETGARHLWLSAPPAASRMVAGMEALARLGNWTSTEFIANDGGYRFDPRSAFKAPLAFARRLTRRETALRQRLDRLGALEAVFVANHTAPVDRFLALEARRRGAKRHYVEDGLVIYLDAHYGHRTYGRSGLGRWSALAREAIYDGYLAAIGRREVMRETPLEFDRAFVFFPQKRHQIASASSAADLRPLLARWLDANRAQVAALQERALARLPGRDQPGRAALLLGQSLAEDLVMPQQLQIKLMRAALESAARRFDRVYYKPHPRDADEKTRAILEGLSTVAPFEEALALPVELLLDGSGVVACLGIWTASLAYLAELRGGIRTYSLLPWMISACRREGVAVPKLERILEEIRPQFERGISWVSSLDEVA